MVVKISMILAPGFDYDALFIYMLLLLSSQVLTAGVVCPLLISMQCMLSSLFLTNSNKVFH